LKIYINKYKNHWVSPYTIVEHVFFWTDWSKCARAKGHVPDDQWIESPKWANQLAECLMPACEVLRNIREFFDRKINYVKIDRWDTWSMDNTLAMIILPMLKQLQASKHGAPKVVDEDVPEYLRSHMAQPKEYELDADELWQKRWDWVLDEMIFTFEKLNEDDWEAEFFTNKEWNKEEWTKVNDRINNGLVLFGKYYRGLWD
jgi:hypothetical protein